MIRAFEFAKPGWMKRWVELDDGDPEMLYQMTELAQTIGCTFRQLPTAVLPHYSMPEDAAQFFLEVPVYYLNPHHEGAHLTGRR